MQDINESLERVTLVTSYYHLHLRLTVLPSYIVCMRLPLGAVNLEKNTTWNATG